MTNYNERLDKILEQAYTDGASDTMWQDERHVEIFATSKQAITSLIKELVEDEFERGYNFGKRDGMREVIKMIAKNGGAVSKDETTDEWHFRIPREYAQHLNNEARRTA